MTYLDGFVIAAPTANKDKFSMKMPDDMPFDSKRMVWGGFEPGVVLGAK